MEFSLFKMGGKAMRLEEFFKIFLYYMMKECSPHTLKTILENNYVWNTKVANPAFLVYMGIFIVQVIENNGKKLSMILC